MKAGTERRKLAQCQPVECHCVPLPGLPPAPKSTPKSNTVQRGTAPDRGEQRKAIFYGDFFTAPDGAGLYARGWADIRPDCETGGLAAQPPFQAQKISCLAIHACHRNSKLSLDCHPRHSTLYP